MTRGAALEWPNQRQDVAAAAGAAAASSAADDDDTTTGAFREWVSSTFSAAAAFAPAPTIASAPSQQVSLAVPSGTPTSLDAEESGNVRLFKDSTPSVVFITNKVLQRNGYSLDATAVPLGAGSGFVYDDKGHIVTNFHVVKGANELTVTFQGDPKVSVAEKRKEKKKQKRPTRPIVSFTTRTRHTYLHLLEPEQETLDRVAQREALKRLLFLYTG